VFGDDDAAVVVCVAFEALKDGVADSAESKWTGDEELSLSEGRPSQVEEFDRAPRYKSLLLSSVVVYCVWLLTVSAST
jgi:hypothetical protein